MLERAERVAVYVVVARGTLDEHQVTLIRKRDVRLLTAIGQHRVESASSQLPDRADANIPHAGGPGTR